MKIVYRSFCILAGGCIMLLSVLFFAVGLMRLFIGDALLYPIPAAAFVQIVLRCLLTVPAFWVGLQTARGTASRTACLCMLACAAAASPFLTNGLDVLFVSVSALALLLSVLSRRCA